jgi:CysZ protein
LLGNAEQEYRSLRKLSLMLSDALESFTQIFSPPFPTVMWKSLGLTAIVLFLLGLGLDRLATSLMPAAPTWLGWILSIVIALGLIASLTLLAAPTTSLVAGFYLHTIADVVEREIDPLGPRGRPLPLSASLHVGLRFAALSLLVNLAVLALTLFTGVGFVAFFVLNGYLLGREYFELAAMRHLPLPQAVELRRQRSFDVFIAGMIVALFVAIPLLNLFTPLFATALMTRMMKRLA